MAKMSVFFGLSSILFGCAGTHMNTTQHQSFAKMGSDGTLVVHLFGTEGGDAVQTYSPQDQNYEAAIKIVGGIRPGECKVIPTYSARVDMLPNRNVVVRELGRAADNGAPLDGVLTLTPADPRYKDVLEKVGVLKPGEFKMMPASGSKEQTC